MFGFKQLPWWASCVSSELTRILSHQGCEVVGLIIDDLLMRSPKCDGHGIATQRYNKARAIMDAVYASVIMATLYAGAIMAAVYAGTIMAAVYAGAIMKAVLTVAIMMAA